MDVHYVKSKPSQTLLTSLEIGTIVHAILIARLPSDRDTSVHYENQYYPDFLFYWLALWACWLYAEQVQLLFVKRTFIHQSIKGTLLDSNNNICQMFIYLWLQVSVAVLLVVRSSYTAATTAISVFIIFLALGSGTVRSLSGETIDDDVNIVFVIF